MLKMRNLIILLLLPIGLMAGIKEVTIPRSPQTLLVECPVNITINEGQKYDTSVTGFPKVIMNDGGEVTITYIEIFSKGNCSNGNDLVTRIFTIRNTIGNLERCTQSIFIKHLTAAQVKVPSDTTINYPKDKGLAETILGMPLLLGSVEVSYIDTKVSNMCNLPIKFKRDWSIKNVCTGEIIKKTTNITLMSYQNSFDQDKTVVTNLCGSEGEITLSPKGEFIPYSYQWNTGSLNRTISGLSAGNYSAVITDGFKCTQLNSTTLTSMAETGDVGGIISTSSNIRVYPDSIYITDSDNIDKFCVSSNGGIQYAFKLKKKNTGFLSYRFVKRTQILEGLSTKDILIIQKHILGKQLLTDTLQYFAADVNNNFSVSSSDIAEMRKLLLGVIPEFPKVLPWYFFRTDWKTTISKFNAYESILFKGINITSFPRLNADVLALKMGDLDYSYREISDKIDTRVKENPAKVYLHLTTVSDVKNNDIAVYLENDAVSLEGFQFALSLQKVNADLHIIQSQIPEDCIFIQNNILKLSFSTGEALDLDFSKPIFTLRFDNNISPNELIQKIEYNTSLRNEYYSSGLIEHELILNKDESTTAEYFFIYPNPSDDYIQFDSKGIRHDAIINIYDLKGRLIYNQSMVSNKRINTSEWPSGNYFYTLVQNDRILHSGTISVARKH